MPVTARHPANEVHVEASTTGDLLEDTMREWLIIAVGAVIGVTIGILIGDVFELSRAVAKIVGIGSTILGACLAMGLATKTGWVKPLSDNV
jgi:uncharacterized membrane protein YadS